jgi:hypothetical protein
MAEDQDAKPDEEPDDRIRPSITVDPPSRAAPRRPGAANKEAALGLEVARLFGVSPRLLVKRAAPPSDPSAPPDEAAGNEADGREPGEGGS